MHSLRFCAALAVLGAPLWTLAGTPESWPQFRGPNCAGVSETAKPPVKIGPSENVLWKVEVPWSPSSPSIWGERIFLTTFQEGELQTRCYNRADGSLIWSKGIKPEQLEVFHRTDGSPAAATPATDGTRVVSYFGSFGLVCYDFDGKVLWRHPLPVAISGGAFGSGTSPIIAEGLVLLNRDQDSQSSLLAVDLKTGKTAWEAARPEMRGSFGTPIVWKNDGVDEAVLGGTLRLKGYDLKTGTERWVVEGITGFVCTTPVLGDGKLFFGAWSPGKADAPWPTWPAFAGQNDTNGDGVIDLPEIAPEKRDFLRGVDLDHDGKVTKSDWDRLLTSTAKSENVLLAVKPGGQGDISDTHIAWKFNRGLPYVPSPLFYGGRVYIVKDGGMLSSLDAESGKPFYTQERLGTIGSYYASPVAADGRIYLASLPGKLTVIKSGGEKPEILHQVDFGERIAATPAPIGNKLYLRTEKHLWAFGE